MIWLLPWESSNDVRHTHWALYALLAINIGVHVLLVIGGEVRQAMWYGDYALVPGDMVWYQWITSSFLHAGWWHLFANMMFLWLFGDNVEDVLGPWGFLLLYFIGGFLGDLLYVSSNPDALIPNVGASGCIAAVAGAHAVLFASRPVSFKVMLLVVPMWTVNMRALWLLLLWFAADIFQTMSARGVMDAPGSNYVVHAGGFVFGFLIGIAARFHGVVVRYETLPQGHRWFGYWPQGLEREFKRKRMEELRRERATVERPERRTSGPWR